MKMPRSEMDARERAFRKVCSDRKLPLTPQRLAIFRALAATDVHPTAEEVFREIQPQMPSLALGTVYRTLEWLEAQGLITRVHDLGEPARFDANRDPHHHLLCIRCRRVVDFGDSQLDALLPRGRRLHGFRVLSHRLQVSGLCPRCQHASGKRR
jgi:Fur family transcriptional regulator, peroxide stress response regulator